ncbi:unnamed protein product [Amoebophrya sp. A25]|nr:unnamed protein product [Amoebophrya sp. A25]|eukprot:GSA25T00001590001.1
MAYNPQYDGGNQQYGTMPMQQGDGYSQEGGYPNMPMAPQDQNTMMQQPQPQPQPYMGEVSQQQPQYVGGVPQQQQPQPYMGGVPQQQPQYVGGVPQQQQQQAYMQQPQQVVMLAVDEAEVKSLRFWNWTVSLEGLFYLYFFFDLVMIIVVNGSGEDRFQWVLGGGVLSYMIMPSETPAIAGVPFAMTMLKMIAMAGFLVMMLVFRCARCISDLHWGQFRKSCGTLIMISVLGSLAAIALLALIVTVGVYAYFGANSPAEAGAGLYFPIIYYALSVIFVLTGLIQILVGYCGLAQKQDEETALLI